jgi:hypothetical protein
MLAIAQLALRCSNCHHGLATKKSAKSDVVCLNGVQKVVSSNLTAPTIFRFSLFRGGWPSDLTFKATDYTSGITIHMTAAWSPA